MPVPELSRASRRAATSHSRLVSHTSDMTTTGRPRAGGPASRPRVSASTRSTRSIRSTRASSGPRTTRTAADRPTGRTDTGPSSRSGASRPGVSARAKDSYPDERRQSAWLRWAVLAIVGIAVLVTLVPTARSLARQRAEIAALEARVAQTQVDVEALKAETEKWADPAYIEQQARERLKFVKPGDRSYTVIDPNATTAPTSTRVTVAAPRADASAPWYGQVWQSVRIADRPAAGATPAP